LGEASIVGKQEKEIHLALMRLDSNDLALQREGVEGGSGEQRSRGSANADKVRPGHRRSGNQGAGVCGKKLSTAEGAVFTNDRKGSRQEGRSYVFLKGLYKSGRDRKGGKAPVLDNSNLTTLVITIG